MIYSRISLVWLKLIKIFYLPETKYAPVPFGKWDAFKFEIRWPPIFAIDIDIADRPFIGSWGLRKIDVIPKIKDYLFDNFLFPLILPDVCFDWFVGGLIFVIEYFPCTGLSSNCSCLTVSLNNLLNK